METISFEQIRWIVRNIFQGYQSVVQPLGQKQSQKTVQYQNNLYNLIRIRNLKIPFRKAPPISAPGGAKELANIT